MKLEVQLYALRIFHRQSVFSAEVFLCVGVYHSEFALFEDSILHVNAQEQQV